jgi:hypothetical protein
MNSLSATLKTNQIRNNALLWAFLKLVVLGVVVWFFEYGIYVAIGYLLYSLEKLAGFQYLNTQETNIAFTELNEVLSNQVASQNRKIEELDLKISELEQQIADTDFDPDSDYE